MKILHSSRSSRVTLPLVFIPENCQQSLDQIRLPLMWDQGPVKPGREWRENVGGNGGGSSSASGGLEWG